MRQYAFSSLPCADWTAPQLIEACTSLGFKGIELRECGNSLISVNMSVQQAHDVSSLFQQAGIAVTNIGSSITIRGTETDGRALQEFKKAVQLAAIMRAKGIRIFLGNFIKRKDDPRKPLNNEGIINWLRTACIHATAISPEIEVWVETHNEFSTGAVLKKLLEDVNHPACKVIYDIIHPLEDGEHPEQTIKLLGDRCAHVHMKDGIPSQDQMIHDWTYTEIGKGALPIAPIVNLLEQEGYKGYYSLEWETAWRRELQELNLDVNEVLEGYIRYMKNL